MSATFTTSRRVEFRATDAGGVMHFTNIIALMEEAEHEFLRQLELPLFRGVAGGTISWPRVAASCEFTSPARFEDVLDIDVVVQRLGNRSVTYGFTLRADSRVVATGSMTSACCLLGGGAIQAVDIHEDVAKKLTPYVVHA